MLPRWHVLLGAIFSLLFLLVFPETNPIYIFLIFLSSFLIDFDHFAVGMIKTKSFSFSKIFDYYNKMMIIEIKERKEGIRRMGDFYLFHTFEFLAITALLGFVWTGFFYIALGMAFHLILDIIDLIKLDFLYRKEFFLTAWLIKSIK